MPVGKQKFTPFLAGVRVLLSSRQDSFGTLHPLVVGSTAINPLSERTLSSLLESCDVVVVPSWADPTRDACKTYIAAQNVVSRV